MATSAVVALDKGIATTVGEVFAQIRPNGSWQGALPPSAVSTGSALIALNAIGDRCDDDLILGAAEWLVGLQEADGGWADAPGGPSTVNATAIGVAALRVLERARPGGIAGVGPVEWSAAVRRGLDRMRAWGGVDVVAERERCT